MANDLYACPGNSLASFLKAAANDLKRRQLEYLIIAFFDENGYPRAMKQLTGRSSWVSSSLSDILAEAKEIKAAGICLVHNHPVMASEKPQLVPSETDIEFQRSFFKACCENNLSYMGTWIVSKCHFTEILYHTLKTAQKGQDDLTDHDIYNSLLPTLKDSIAALTKPLVVVLDWYDIGYIAGHHNRRLKVQTRTISPLDNSESPVYQLLITITEIAEVTALERFNAQLANGNKLGQYEPVAEYSDILSLEEATRACDAIEDIYDAARKLAGSTAEYKEVKLSLTDNSICGFFQKATNQSAFVTINGQSVFLDVTDLHALYLLFIKALDQLDVLANPNADPSALAVSQTEQQSSQKIKVSIKGPDDNKKLYLVAKQFYTDAGVSFEKAKDFLTKGVIMSFEDKNKALVFIEKYNQLGCKTAMKDTPV